MNFLSRQNLVYDNYELAVINTEPSGHIDGIYCTFFPHSCSHNFFIYPALFLTCVAFSSVNTQRFLNFSCYFSVKTLHGRIIP